MSVRDFLTDTLRLSSLTSFDIFVNESVILPKLFGDAKDLDSSPPDLGRWEYWIYLITQEICLLHALKYFRTNNRLLNRPNQRRCTGLMSLLEYEAEQAFVPDRSATATARLQNFLERCDRTASIDDLFEKSIPKMLVSRPTSESSNKERQIHFNKANDLPTHIRILFHSSYNIADFYFLFHLTRSVWCANKEEPPILAAQRDVLQNFVDKLDKWKIDVSRGTTIFPDFVSLRDQIIFALAKARGIMPSGLFETEVDVIGDNPLNGGGFADVWMGKLNDGYVALKVLRPRHASSDDGSLKQMRSLCREAVLWRMTNHPNVLKFCGLYRIGDARGTVAFISPWMRHGNLLNYVQRNGGVNRQDLLAQTGTGLLYLHSIDVIHGDLKCANVLVDDNGIPQLSDFGLSTVEPVLTTASGSMSYSGGNPRWLAPELIFPGLFTDSGRTTRESDVYAFGMTALELFTERVPFHDLFSAALPFEIALNGLQPTWPGRHAEERGLTKEIWAMIRGCWDRIPSERTKLQFGLLESSLISLTALPISLRNFWPTQNVFPRIAMAPKPRTLEKEKKRQSSSNWSSNIKKLTLYLQLRSLAETEDGNIFISSIHVTARIISTHGRGRCSAIDRFWSLPPSRDRNVAEFLGTVELPLLSATALLFNVGHSAESLLDHLQKMCPLIYNKSSVTPQIISERDILMKVMSDIANGVAHLHEHQIIHGNLKCASIVVENGFTLLVDYGLHACTGANRDFSVRGRFRAPELSEVSQHVGERVNLMKGSDVYAMGLTFYEVLTGRMLQEYQAPEVTDFVSGAAMKDIESNPALDDTRRRFPWIWSLMCRCWFRDAQERPTAAGVRHCIDRLRFWRDILGVAPDKLIPVYLSEEQPKSRTSQKRRLHPDDIEDTGIILRGSFLDPPARETFNVSKLDSKFNRFQESSTYASRDAIKNCYAASDGRRTKWRRVDGWMPSQAPVTQ